MTTISPIERKRERDRLWRQAFYDDNRLILNWLKDKPCLDCGGEFPVAVMEYHHRDPSTKEFTVAKGIAYPWWKLVLEIAKCDLLCANCHRLR